MTRLITCPGCARAPSGSDSGVRCGPRTRGAEWSHHDMTKARAAKIVVSDATIRCVPRLWPHWFRKVTKKEIQFIWSTSATAARMTAWSAAACHCPGEDAHASSGRCRPDSRFRPAGTFEPLVLTSRVTPTISLHSASQPRRNSLPTPTGRGIHALRGLVDDDTPGAPCGRWPGTPPFDQADPISLK